MAGKPFAISRSKLDHFLECPRCFCLDRRLQAADGDLPVAPAPEQAIRDAHACLNAQGIPAAAEGCDYCAYVAAVAQVQEEPGR
jgi:hypothetical protein